MVCSRVILDDYISTFNTSNSGNTQRASAIMPLYWSQTKRASQPCSVVNLILVSVCMHTVCSITTVYGKVIPLVETHRPIDRLREDSKTNQFFELWDTISDQEVRSEPERWTSAASKRNKALTVSKSYEHLLLLLARDRYHSVRKCCEQEVMKPVGGGHLTGTCCTELRYMDTIIYRVRQWIH